MGTETRILGLVLAGGASRRMGGCDKALCRLGGEPLVARVTRRLQPQVDRLMISGPADYGLGHATLPDRSDGARGPAAALHAAYRWCAEHRGAGIGAVVTVPVDGPFFPRDLVARLASHGVATIAETACGPHPTFACWPLDALAAAAPLLAAPGGLALRRLADAVGAQAVHFGEEEAFFNINTPADLARAETWLATTAEPQSRPLTAPDA